MLRLWDRFQREERNSWRKKVLEHSEAIVLRDPISEKYVRDFCSG